MKLIYFILLFSSCAQAPGTVEAQYQPYLNTFINEAKIRGIPTDDVEYVTIKSVVWFDETDQVGQCDEGSKTIEVLQSYWDASDHYEREELLMHELGHCVFYYGHTYKYPAIMYPYTLGSYTYFSNRTQLLDDFYYGNFPENAP